MALRAGLPISPSAQAASRTTVGAAPTRDDDAGRRDPVLDPLLDPLLDPPLAGCVGCPAGVVPWRWLTIMADGSPLPTTAASAATLSVSCRRPSENAAVAATAVSRSRRS